MNEALPGNPIFNRNKFKLGLFCANSATPQMSAAHEKPRPTWSSSLDLMKKIDGAGFEAMVSVSTWRGPVMGDPGHISHFELEPFTWCAALAACSSYSAIITTFHTQITYPAFVAKASATIDQISGGRAGLNVVAGSKETTYGQFGVEVENATQRYDHTEEFIEVVKRFWSEDEEFDYQGRFTSVRRGISRPRPLQRPGPVIMNAGASGRGQHFAAKHADIAFTHFKEDESLGLT